MALSSRFLDEVRSRTGLSDLIGRKVKLTRAGKEFQGLCPFHSEKSPSFTVNDQKGFYHCFGCGAHGSAFDFVMETEGVGFRESVEQLAALAGLEMPEDDPRETARAQATKSLAEVMNDVAQWYQAQLRAKAGREALVYLENRGIKSTTMENFRLGYAPRERTALKEAMLARGISEQDLIDTGMVIKPEDDGVSYDRFRNRIMFPISDRQGRLIAFGGRALDKNAKAKYLNSPETTIFHKGATLYNWPAAHKAAYQGGELVVVEGYMDVIALWEAGIKAAVAPLGTALTEDQMSHLWGMANEPILAFDGDQAGLRAAKKAANRSLPLLKPGKSLRFLLMTDQQDPDDFVRAKGKDAFEAKMDSSSPLVDFLWQDLTGAVDISTPERRAGLEKTIFTVLGDIQDENIRKLYQSEFRSRLWDQFKAFRGLGKNGYGHKSGHSGDSTTFRVNTFTAYKRGWDDKKYNRQFSPFNSLQDHQHRAKNMKASLLASDDASAQTARMERLLSLIIVHHPFIMVRYEEDLATLPFCDSSADDVKAGVLFVAGLDQSLETGKVQDHLRKQGLSGALDNLLHDQTLKRDWFAWPAAAPADALTAFEHILSRFVHLTQMQQAYLEAEQNFAEDMTEENQRRFLAAQAAFRNAEEKETTIDNFGLESNRLKIT